MGRPVSLKITKTALAALLLVAARSLWQLRAWARTTLEVFSWLGLVVEGAFVAFWAYAWSGTIGFASTLPVELALTVGLMFGFLLAVVGLLIASIFLLRSASVRRAVDSATFEALAAATTRSGLPLVASGSRHRSASSSSGA